MPPRAAPRSMKMASPLGQGGLQGDFGAVTDNLVWVVHPETHPGASVKASQSFTLRGRGFSKEFFMPRCGATFDENSVPPWTRGDFRGVLGP